MELKVELSASSLSAARERLEEYIASLPLKADEGARLIADAGEAQAKASAPVETGALRLSIQSERWGEGDYRVTARSVDGNGHSYAAFAEFGTGVVGASAGYPGALPDGYGYGEGLTPKAHQGDGWWFDHPDDGRTFTRGQAGKHYMADAAAAMRQCERETMEAAFNG